MRPRYKAAVCAIFLLGLIPAAHANQYNVNTMGAFLGVFDGNSPNLGFYKYDADTSSEEGSAATIFSTEISNGGLSATVTWTGPQPHLTAFYLKSASKYAVWDIANFNDNPYTSIFVTNDIIKNPAGNYTEISHVSLGVPDGGMTSVLLGSALIVFALAGFRWKAKHTVP